MKNVTEQCKKVYAGLEHNTKYNKRVLIAKKFFFCICLLGIILFRFSIFIGAYSTSSISPVYLSQHPRPATLMSSNGSASTSNIVSFNNYNINFSTYFGGNGYDLGYSIAADNNGNTYITGSTSSPELLPLKNAYQSTYGGKSDAFVAKFNATGGLMFSTYFGGNGTDVGDAIAVDSYGNIYITGQTNSTDLPLKSAYQSTY